MGSREEARERLEAQAAAILADARNRANEILRRAHADADDVRARADRYAAAKVAEADAAREAARRELVQAQEQALAIRSEAQRHADSLLRRATARARTEADELLREAQRQLAKAVEDAREAEARAAAARAAEAETLERLLAVAPPEERTAVRVKTSTGAVTVVGADEEDDGWLIDLTRDRNSPLEELVAGAVRAAVHKAVNPIVIRAGRYTVIADPNGRN